MCWCVYAAAPWACMSYVVGRGWGWERRGCRNLAHRSPQYTPTNERNLRFAFPARTHSRAFPPKLACPQSDELKTFESGGKYADENAAAYKRSLAAIDAHLERAWSEQRGRLEASRAALAGEVSEAGSGAARQRGRRDCYALSDSCLAAGPFCM